jgi:hypothetical protein
MFRFNLALVAVCVAASPIGVTAQIIERPEVELSAAQFRDLRGEYLLDDGSRLSIAGVRLRPLARLDDRPPVPLQVAGPNRLVSRDGRWRLEFQSRADGVDAVVLTMQSTGR